MITYWIDAEPQEYPLLAYLAYASSLTVFKSRKSQPDAKLTLFSEIEAASVSDDVVASGKQDYTMKLPYTEIMLQRRYERGADVPTWFLVNVEAA